MQFNENLSYFCTIFTKRYNKTDKLLRKIIVSIRNMQNILYKY